MDKPSSSGKEQRETDDTPDATEADSGALGAGEAFSGANVGEGGTGAGSAMGSPMDGALAMGVVAAGMAAGLVHERGNSPADPDVEDAHWRERHPLESYGAGEPYDLYEPAYRAGYEGFGRHEGACFADVEPAIRKDYESHKGDIPWSRARPAAEAAWTRMSQRSTLTEQEDADEHK